MDFGLIHIRTQIYFEMKPIDIFLITVIWLTRNTLTNLLITYWLNLFVKFCFCTRHSPFCVMFCFDSESVARYWFDIVWYELQRYEIKIKKKTCFHLSVTLWYFYFFYFYFLSENSTATAFRYFILTSTWRGLTLRTRNELLFKNFRTLLHMNSFSS